MVHPHAHHGQRPHVWGPPQYKYYGPVKQNDPSIFEFVVRRFFGHFIVQSKSARCLIIFYGSESYSVYFKMIAKFHRKPM